MDNETELRTGLSMSSPKDWPKWQGKHGIDALEDEDTHALVLEHLLDRLNFSEKKMSQFYARWQVNEKKVQAYVSLGKLDEVLKAMNDRGKPPQITNIIMPYEFATIWTIVTYLMQVFCGRRPMFTVQTNNSDLVKNAMSMENYLQYNAEHVRLVKTLYHFLQDSQTYGLGILRTNWIIEERYRTVRQKQDQTNFLGELIGQRTTKGRELKKVFEGTDVICQDPYMFFPDPRVPMTEVNRRGEFVFWRDFIGLHDLKKLEAAGDIKFLSRAKDQLPANKEGGSESVRALRSEGESLPGSEASGKGIQNFRQVDQGSVEIIPAELGLGESTTPEKWMFTIVNKSQIVAAQPIEFDHGMHPVCVTEPLVMGKGFGNLAMSDMLGPIQDAITWLLNSHMDNVRRTLNNQFIVDPSMIEMQDLANPGPGKHIRLKRSAYGQDIRTAIQQLPITDVTASHIGDLNVIMMMGEKMSSVTDNLMGLQDRGGRKSATEVRRAGDSGASRLAMMATLISAQAISDLAEQMVINAQQFVSDDFTMKVLGQDGSAAPINISAQTLVGDFNYPVHDGTLPVDKIAMLDVWKEILMGVAADPELRQTYSLPQLFEWVARLGGASNIANFKIQMSPMDMITKQLQAGNVIPLGGANGLPAPSGQGIRQLQGKA